MPSFRSTIATAANSSPLDRCIVPKRSPDFVRSSAFRGCNTTASQPFDRKAIAVSCTRWLVVDRDALHDRDRPTPDLIRGAITNLQLATAPSYINAALRHRRFAGIDALVSVANDKKAVRERFSRYRRRDNRARKSRSTQARATSFAPTTGHPQLRRPDRRALDDVHGRHGKDQPFRR
jgi:hypothetical protein